MPVPIPHSERAPLMRVFGSLAEQVAILIRLRPALAQRLVFAPPEALHAVAAFLHHGVNITMSDAEVADMIMNHHPRGLLLLAFPEAPPTLYRALRRGGDRASEAVVYSNVVALATGRFADRYLSDNPLSRSRRAFYLALTQADPIVGQIARALPEDLAIIEAIDSFIAVLRAHVGLNDAELCLPPMAGKSAVLRRLLRLLDSVPMPPPSFSVPEPYRVVTSIGELRRVGLTYRNCIRDLWSGPRYWLSAARGEDVFVTCAEPMVVARFARVAPGLYTMSEMAAPSNASVSDSDKSTLLAALRASGAQIIDDDPYELMNSAPASAGWR